MNYTIAPMVKPFVADAPYFVKIFNNLKNKLNDDYHFILARSNNEEEKFLLKNCIDNTKKNILVLLSDEFGIIPPFLDEFLFVFRTYSNKKLHDDKKIFPVPCGFSLGYDGYFGNSDWRYDDCEKPKKPLKERTYDFFYSAQISHNRLKCVESLNTLKTKFNSIVNVTDGFAKGYKLEEYYELMSNSKIAIVPDGAVVPESFRYFESFENNCIVITTYPKNNEIFNNWFYEDSPAIFLNDWSELTEELIKNLLSEQSLESYEEKNRYYFNNKISTNAISEFILKTIQENENII